MMMIDNQQRFGAPNLDHMSSYQNTPHFTNPWSSTSPPSHGGQGMYSQSRAATGAPLPSYGSIPVSAPSGSTLTADVFGQQDLLNMPQDLMNLSRMQTTSAPYGEAGYTTTASPVHATYAASPSPYEALPGYATAPLRSTFALAPDAEHRRYSQSSVASNYSSDLGPSDVTRASRNSLIDLHNRGVQQDDRRSFADALDASHGMLAMSQETPRAIYPPNRGRNSADSYGFPPTHSSASSISSASNYGSGFYGGSIDSSMSDYSTAGSDIESVHSARSSLPRPSLMTHAPPAPQSMMGQFSSKVSSSTQKKHKCKVCDKRFTRPSSLQTHMYSHTGEKPFCCEVEGCGRHFSVVSNLRRHRKVHKNDTRSEAGSEVSEDLEGQDSE